MSQPSLARLLDTLSGRFELRGWLGSGGMGFVHRAFDHALGREVALKTLRASDPTLLYSLKQEFRAAASLCHPNLVQLHELFVVGSECFFTMELVDGVPFTRFVRQGWVARLPTPRTTLLGSSPNLPDTESSAPAQSAILRTRRGRHRGELEPAAAGASVRLSLATAQLVAAVAALHEAGRIHCDIKPSNILITAGGRLVLLDFGLSSPLQGQLGRAEFAGTLTYAAPEQLWGEPLTPATDWYSVGGVLFEAVTGRLPAEDLRKTAARHVNLPGFVDPAFLDSVAALLEPNPADRPVREVILRALGEGGASAGADPHFVGRAAERRRLELALQSAASGWLTAVDVHGESGIGKTELVRQFALEAARRGALVAHGQCRLQESVSHQALDQIVDDLSAYLSALPRQELATFLPQGFSNLVRMFPVLGRVAAQCGVAPSSPDTADAAAVREQATRVLRTLLWRICAEHPVLLWIDDAHWGDAESLRLLCELLEPPAPPLLLILSHRDARAPWVSACSDIVAQSNGQWLDVPTGALGVDESRRLARQWLGTDLATDEPLVARIAAEAEGLPLFLGQLCRSIAERVAAGAAADRLALSLREVVEGRVGELSGPERRIVELAALVEAPLPVAVILTAAGSLVGGSLLVFRLAAAQLLKLSGARSEPSVASFHQRVREIVLTGLNPAQQRSGHRALVDAMDHLRGLPEPETLLYHLLGAGERERALAVARRAAAAATHRLAFAHAASLYRTAVELCECPGELDAALQRNLADALAAAGQAGAAGEQFLALAERADAAESLRLLQRAAENFLVGGFLERGVAVLGRALTLARLRLPTSRIGAVLQGLAQIARFWLRARLPARVLRGRAEALDPLRAELCLSAAKGFGVVDPMLSAHFAFLALNLADRAGDAVARGSALCLSGMILAAAPGRLGKWGSAWLDEASRSADALARASLRGTVDVCRGQVELASGNWSGALAHCESASHWLALERDATTWERNMARVISIRALEELGDSRRAWASAAEWLTDARVRGDLYAETTARLYLAFAQLASDRPDETERMATLTLQQWTEKPPPFQEFYRLRALAYARLYREQPEAALELAERADQTLRSAQLQHFPVAILEICLLRARIRSCLCAQSGARTDGTARECERDLERMERLGRPDARGHAALLRAGLELRRGRCDRARALLRSARDQFNARQMSLACAYVTVLESCLPPLPGDPDRWLEAEAVLRSRGIVRPLAWLAMHGVHPGVSAVRTLASERAVTFASVRALHPQR
jgi:eukaryotic-like serine/threonine-protein kinase